MRPNSRCLWWDEAGRRGIAIAALVRNAFTRIALVRIALVGIALVVCGAACSSSKGPGSDGGPGAAGTGGTDAAADRASDGADANGSTCQQIRLCAFNCADEACVTSCAQHGSPAAQVAFQNVRSCTQAAAPDGGGCTSVSDPSYRNCFCLAQCLESPPCAATLDPCLGNIDDSICDGCA